MSKDSVRLAAALNVSRSAAARMTGSLTNDVDLMRAGSAAGDHADSAQLRAIDAFVQRYQQLFEHMASRLVGAVYRAEEHGARPPAFRSLLIWAEEVGLIANSRIWAERAELRNRLVHEYPVEAELRAEALLAAIAEGRRMLDELRLMIAYIAANNLLETGQT